MSWIKIPKTFLIANLSTWIAVFATWVILESTFRIFFAHPYWTVSRAIVYMARNLLYYVMWGIIIGILHTLLLAVIDRMGTKGARLRVFLSPGLSVAATTVLAPIILLEYHNFMIQFNFMRLITWVPGFLILAVVYIIFIYAFRPLSAYLDNMKKFTLYGFVTTMIFVPIVFIIALQSLRSTGQKITEEARGPVKYVILISIDTLRYDYIGSYGSFNVQTPVIDKIAKEGVRFQHAFSPVPITGPSHISMLTGKSPLIHEVTINGQQLSHSTKTLSERLRDAGFQTGAFVSSFPLTGSNCGLDRGFQLYNDKITFHYYFNDTYFGRIGDKIFFRSSALERPAGDTTDLAIRWLSKNADTPFFLFIHYFEPHYPYGRTASFRSFEITSAIIEDLPNQKRLYAGEVKVVDSQIGRIAEFLKQRGIYDDTLIIITADHGESLGEHNYYYDHSEYIYEQSIRIPLIIRCPLLIKPGVVFNGQVSLIDIYKTILSAVGLKSTPDLSSYDLIRLVREQPKDFNRLVMSHVFAPEAEHDSHSIRTLNWKLIRTDKDQPTYELYNLTDDPGEMVNLINTNKKKAFGLKNSLKERLYLMMPKGRRHKSLKDLKPEQLQRLKSLGYFQ